MTAEQRCSRCGHRIWAAVSRQRGYCEACQIKATGKPTPYEWKERGQ